MPRNFSADVINSPVMDNKLIMANTVIDIAIGIILSSDIALEYFQFNVSNKG